MQLSTAEGLAPSHGRRAHTDPRQSGFTLVELVLATVLLTIVLGSLTFFGRQSALALRTSTTQAELDQLLNGTLVRIARELLPSGLGVITPDASAPAGAAVIDYRKSAGVVSGALVWGPPHRIGFELEAGELDDGLDNNANGLVDEGVVVLTIDPGVPGERRTVLCHGVRALAPGELANGGDDDGDGLVDERGLFFERVGPTLRVSLTLVGRDPQGRQLERTLDTLIQPRN